MSHDNNNQSIDPYYHNQAIMVIPLHFISIIDNLSRLLYTFREFIVSRHFDAISDALRICIFFDTSVLQSNIKSQVITYIIGG